MQTIIELGVCAGLSVVVYAFWIKPKLVIGTEFVEVINPIRSQVIRYSEIIDLETKWSLLIIHSNGKTRVWVAPASGKQRWIADKKFGWYGSGLIPGESRNGGEESMSSSLNSISGQAAYMIRERIKRSH
jgi:hypothetical protein